MVLKGSKWGRFYGCSRWRDTGCEGSHGAYEDGSPLGLPANKETKRARGRAHKTFDKLWKKGHMTRPEAYQWMQVAMTMSEEEVHIARFDIEQCEELIVKAGKKLCKIDQEYRKQEGED